MASAMHDYNTLLILNGAAKAMIWGYGAGFAFYRRRGLLAPGFGIACVISAMRAILDAQEPTVNVSIVAYAATPACGLIVASFVGRQPLRAPRPARWTL